MKNFYNHAEWIVNLICVIALGITLVRETVVSGWKAEIFPLSVGALTLLLFAGRIFLPLFRPMTKVITEDLEGGEVHLRKVAGVILSTVGLYVLILIAGFSIATLIYLVTMPFLLRYRKPFSTILVAVALYGILILSASKGILTLP